MSKPTKEKLIDLESCSADRTNLLLEKALDELNSIITTKIKRD